MPSKSISTISILSLTAMLMAGCSTKTPLLRSLEVSPPNPTSWIFPLGVDDLHKHVHEAFWRRAMERYPDFAPWERYTIQPGNIRDDLWRSFLTRSPKYKTTHDPLFDDPSNSNDLLIEENLDTLSIVYCGPKGGLLYFAKYHFHFEPVDDQHTRMSVNVIRPRVVTRVAAFGWHGTPVDFQDVPPTTVEEYKILRFIGATLDIAMPIPNVPRESCDDAAP